MTDTANVGIKVTDIVAMEVPGHGLIPGFVEEIVPIDTWPGAVYRVRAAFSGKVFRQTEDTLRTMTREAAAKVRRDMTCFGRGSRMKVIALHLSEDPQSVAQIHGSLEAEGWGWSKDTVRRTLDAMTEQGLILREVREVVGVRERIRGHVVRRPAMHYALKGSTR